MSEDIGALGHVDVLVIGAGISGIGAAHYLRTLLPDVRFTILESRGQIGGTWDLFRYPGVRSDSDLFTFGYEFRPWTGDSIATGEAILDYLADTVTETGLDDGTIKFHHRVTGLDWDSAQARWTVRGERTDTDGPFTLTAGWVFGATGYYDYEQPHTVALAGAQDFAGALVHPQFWPQDLAVEGRRVAVIGSGATAVTLVPALAERGAHVTMVQRTPTYVLPLPTRDAFADITRKALGDKRAHRLTRRKNIAQQRALWLFCQRFPRAARRLLRRVNVSHLPDGYPVDVHFNPPYDPWDQRLCTVPDGDLFTAIGSGRADIVTGHIERLSADGVLMESGQHVPADIVVTATGLRLQLLGGVGISVDGQTVDLSDRVAYKGMMLSGIPNLAFSIGYTNSSWTLKVGLLCEHFCRILGHMRREGLAACAPVLADPSMARRPLLDFKAGYVQRAIDRLPKQGDRAPWRMSMGYREDVALIRRGPVVDEHLRFARAGERLELPDAAVPASASHPDGVEGPFEGAPTDLDGSAQHR